MASKFELTKDQTVFYTSNVQREILSKLKTSQEVLLGTRASIFYRAAKTLDANNPAVFNIQERKEHYYGKNVLHYYLSLRSVVF